MKRITRILSLLLVLAMLAGMVPAVSAGSRTEAGVSRTELAYEGTTAFGDLLAGELTDYQAQEDEDSSWVSDLEIVDGTALVDVALEREATVLVCIYDETTGEMVTSGYATAGSLDSYVTIELENLPQYYEVKVYVVDPLTYEPLCGVYTSEYYTKTMQEILALTVEDFDPERVLNLDENNETNFAVYKDGTVVVRQDNPGTNRLTVSGSKYRFSFPTRDITNLEEGDVLVYISLSEEIHIIKVGGISSNRIEATITVDSELEMTEVFDLVKIEAELDPSTSTVNTEGMDEGVTYTGMETRNTRSMAAGESLGTEIFFGFKFEDLEIVDGLTLNGSLGLTLKAKFEYYIASFDITNSSDISHVRLELGYDAGIEFSVKASFLEKEIKLAEIIVMSICGVNFLVRPYFVASAEAEISVNLVFTGTAGFEFRSKGFNYTVDDLYTKPKLDSELKLEGTIFVGIKLVPAITVICDDVGKIDLSAKAGLEIKAALVGTEIDPDPEDHACSYCLDGSIRVKCTLTLGFNFLKVFRLDVDLVKYERFLADFYYSFDLKEFGFGTCPQDYAGLPSIIDGVLKQDSGTCGDKLEWTMYESGALYITGEGEMYDYDSFMSETPWDKYTEDILYVIIDEGATSIGGAAFDGCENLFSVQLPGSLTAIGTYAFSGCASLEDIELPEEIEVIEAHTFSGCTGLSSIVLSADLEQIKSTAFRGCKKLQSIDLPVGLETIGSHAFENCTSLQTVDFPYTLTEIGQSAFLNCTSLVEADLPDRLESLGEDAFQECTALETLYIGDSLTRIEDSTFYNCTALTEIWLGNNMSYVGEGAFWNCAALETLEIPESVRILDSYAFISCENLYDITFNEGLKEINYEAFKGCSSLTDLSFPDSLTYIGKFVFQDCTDLSIVDFGDNLETINTGAFQDCTSLLEVHMPHTVTALGDEAFMGCTSLDTVTMSNGLTEMGSSVFYDCTALTDVTIGTALEEISGGAFWNCAALETIEIPANVRSLDNYAFISCDNLSDVILHEGLEEIGYETFKNCPSLTEIDLPDSLTYIGKFAFQNDLNLYTVRFGPNVETINTGAFQDCTNLQEVQMPDALTTLGDEAFMGCTSLRTVTMSDGLTDMGSSVFYGCTFLSDVTIGSSLEEIGNSAFWGCTALAYIEIPGNVRDLGKYTFTACESLRTVVLNEGLEKIGYESFNNCEVLDDVTVPSTVTTVGKFAFSGCEGMSTLRFTGDAPELGKNCFEDVTATVYYPSNRSGWTSDILLDYGGSISWSAYAATGSNAARSAASPAAVRAVTVTSHDTSGLSNSARYLLVIAKSADEPLLAADNLIYVAQFISDKSGNVTVDWPLNAAGYYIALYGEDGVTVLQKAGTNTAGGGPCDGGADCPGRIYVDMPAAGNWAHAGIDYVTENGLMQGMGNSKFEPNTTMTRAMLVTVLWRYAGSPVDGVNTFTDVRDGQWYTQAIAWAAKNGVVNGVGNGKFDPNGLITREQMAAILYRYAANIGIDVSASTSLSAFPDGGRTSGYAVESVEWAVAVGLIQGVGSQLQPRGNATRAQVATILMRFIENVVK